MPMTNWFPEKFSFFPTTITTSKNKLLKLYVEAGCKNNVNNNNDNNNNNNNDDNNSIFKNNNKNKRENI